MISYTTTTVNFTIYEIAILAMFEPWHGMACPQVADGGDSLQIWRVTSNILNKQL
jgi:hypothetical protein